MQVTGGRFRIAPGQQGPSVGVPRPRSCVAAEHCREDPVPYAPVDLCPRHMRQVYAFARDFIEVHVETAIAEMSQAH